MEISELVDFEIAERAALKGLCDHCLGRQFAKVGHGMTNKERGFYIRTTLASLLKDDREKAGSLHPPYECWLCENIFNEIEKFAELIVKNFGEFNYDTFLIGSKIDAEIVEREEQLWGELGNDHYEPIKAEINREVGKIVEEKIKKPVNFEKPDIVAVIDTRYDNVELQVSPLFIYGRYRKFIRGIPQTRWDCKQCWGKGCEKCNNTGKMYQTSVEELIAAKVMDATQGAEHSFHGMGREDIDARMLGNGRPFVLEVKIPLRRRLDLERLEELINTYTEGKVAVSDLRTSSKKEVAAIKEAKVLKTYDVEVTFEKPIKHAKLKEVVRVFKDRTIEQKTPSRVLHRRADKVRKRNVVDIGITSVEKKGATKIKSAKLSITGESGIYVKELIHGDEGRTQPNIAEYLKTKCDVKCLDVMHIHDDNGGGKKW